MDYRFKLVVPEKKAQRIFDITNDYFDKFMFKKDEEIAFPIDLKDGKKLVLKLVGEVDDWSDNAAPDRILAWTNIFLFNIDGSLLAEDGVLTNNFFDEFKLEYGGDNYVIKVTYEGSLKGANNYNYVKKAYNFDWLE